jgi:hypothetical protein
VGSINLLEWHTEFRDTHYQFIIKDVSKAKNEESDERDRWGRQGWVGLEFSCPL